MCLNMIWRIYRDNKSAYFGLVSTPEVHSLRSRPRFRRQLPGEPENYLVKLADALEARNEWEGSVIGTHAFIRVCKPDQHFWSPHLGIELEEHEGGTLLRGLYGPKPALWTFFVFLYSGAGFATLALLFWGGSQFSLGQSPWALWLAPLGLVAILLVYLLAQFGQKLGYEQMEQLHEVLLEELEKAAQQDTA